MSYWMSRLMGEPATRRLSVKHGGGPSPVHRVSPPDEPSDEVFRFRVAVLTIGHRGPPHPSPLPKEREQISTVLERPLDRGLFVRRQIVHPLLGERAGVRGTDASERPELGFDSMAADKCRAPMTASRQTDGFSGGVACAEGQTPLDLLRF